ncbi:dihydroorotate dehydrogenase [Lagierella sp.]|uniref:dihydroorotate dehydrogenase n=1 Tax=Lagierella sp. TaxID=2849657 RepID=UPI00260726BD|nr:dihydroorotate dehydrogenase [Lagierella sp.]
MLETNICDIVFKNPVIAASGTFGFGREYEPYVDFNKIGGIATSGVTYKAKPGNRGIRIHETPSGIMNSIGLQNPSTEEFIKNDLEFLRQFDTKVLVNVGGSTIDDYIKSIELLNETDIKIIELNISCPNVKEGGMAFGIKCEIAEEVVKKVRAHTDKVLIVKLSPNAENIKDMAVKCVEAGADGLSLVNTFNAIAVDIYNKKPVFNNITAGLSGPAIKPIALRMVRDVASVVNVPIIGIGGIMDWKDAIEFIMVGATAVQVGTANFVNPNSMVEIAEGMANYMKDQGIKSLDEIRGII